MNRTINVLEHMLKHCNQIAETIKRFGNNFNEFNLDFVYKDTISMNLLQIGELVRHLPKEFKTANSSIPWKQIQGMRNLFAHAYGSMDNTAIWTTANEDIPVLKKFCQDQIEMKKLLEQEAIEPEYDEDEFEM